MLICITIFPQLNELLGVRHSVFIVGDSGTGKTNMWKTLFRTYHNQKLKPSYTDLNPKAVTNDELYGIINPATREWKDGLFSNIMRDMANLPGEGPKWIILDGDIDPMWIESLNTVMDDNKILTLASNERIALTPAMKLLFEISNLRTATPATVSRAGILYINPEDLGWNPYVTSWVERRENAHEKTNLTILFDKYTPGLQAIIKNKFKKITPIPGINHVKMLCSLLEAVMTPSNIPQDAPRELYELYFVFVAVWSYGSALFHDGQSDFRAEFSKWFTHEFKSVKFPLGMSVFDVWVDPVAGIAVQINVSGSYYHYLQQVSSCPGTTGCQSLSWTRTFPCRQDLENPQIIPITSTTTSQACLVHNSETIRIKYFLDILVDLKFPVMLIGAAGSGKTLIINEKLGQMDEDFLIANVPFNFYYNSELTQKILEKPLEKKAGKNYGPPGSKKLIYFLDDMNMPEVFFANIIPILIIVFTIINLLDEVNNDNPGGQVWYCGPAHHHSPTYGLRTLVCLPLI